ncbi:MAG: hypothetical protein IKZ55_03690 [Bacteroidales bacterium]|nr:hypothetical protein [Bacteroidales bacterium]
MSIQVFPNVSTRLNSLIIDRGKPRLLTEQKPVNANCDNVEFVLQQCYQRQEYLMRHAQPWNQQQTWIFFISVGVECHSISNPNTLFKNSPQK